MSMRLRLRNAGITKKRKQMRILLPNITVNHGRLTFLLQQLQKELKFGKNHNVIHENRELRKQREKIK